MLGQAVVNGIFCCLQVCAVIFCFVALCTNQWITGVETDDTDDRYFDRVDLLQYQYFLTNGQQDDTFASIGLFRIWADDDRSYSLPILDTELKLCKTCLTLCILMGFASLYAVSFQLVHIFTELLAFELLIGWAAVFQAILTLAGTSTAMRYFQKTFVYESSGFSLFSGWIAFCVQLMLVVCSVFKVLLTRRNVKKIKTEKKKQMQAATLNTPRPVAEYEQQSIRPATSENRLYQPAPAQNTPRYATADRGGYHRPGAYSPQQFRDDYPAPRRSNSYDSKQFDGHLSPPPARNDRNDSYDQGDLPRYR